MIALRRNLESEVCEVNSMPSYETPLFRLLFPARIINGGVRIAGYWLLQMALSSPGAFDDKKGLKL